MTNLAVNRRTLFAGLGAAAITGATALTTAKSAQAASLLPMTIANRSGRSDGWLVVTGVLPGGQEVYATPDGRTIPVQNAPTLPNGALNIWQTLPAAGANRLIQIPQMSGRIYFCFGNRLIFRRVLTGDGRWGTVHPSGWTVTDPNFGVRYDVAEFTYYGGMVLNQTQVDMASLSLSVGVTDQTGLARNMGRMYDGALARISQKLAKIPGHGQLVTRNKLRILSPGHAIEAGLFPRGYYDGYVNRVWDYYRTHDLVINYPSGICSGRVGADGLLRLIPRSGEIKTLNIALTPYRKPSTLDVFGCVGALAAPNDRYNGPIGAILGAAFNRSTLLRTNVHPVIDPAKFYLDPITNHYSKLLHPEHINGKAYGFPFDDVSGFDSTVSTGAGLARSAVITLHPNAPLV